ncbi:hypothetical protein HDF26_001419 [Pedobacter cryoconitis]|uniref:Uncharacterized protein n=1 Tax=Pedobacter cryoconitis TaxID=188932 RepID=A0A7W9E175_9SPHI|nr:hypothetical protein [Pedobacter cryoconitis]MBB6270992.1 hypothetical protein [Pedobacter cryoconitis]
MINGIQLKLVSKYVVIVLTLITVQKPVHFKYLAKINHIKSGLLIKTKAAHIKHEILV